MNPLRPFAFFCCMAVSVAQAQTKIKPAGQLSPENYQKLHAAEDTLALLAFAIVNDSIEMNRFAACRTFITSLVRALKTENSFHYPFERLKSISQLAPPDSSFRIFTWQLFVNDSTYKYYGAIQKNAADLQLIPLVDRSADMEEVPCHETLTPENWYGALYYNIRQFDEKSGRKYLLCGFDAFSFFERRKLIEVLSFDEAGKAVFGAKVFDRQPQKGKAPTPPDFRIAIEYSAESSVRCNWDDQYEMILWDHLIPNPSPFGSGMTNVPDGSVDGLKLEKGRWKFISKVFNDAQAEPPRPEPLFDVKSNKNIIGREKKKIGW